MTPKERGDLAIVMAMLHPDLIEDHIIGVLGFERHYGYRCKKGTRFGSHTGYSTDHADIALIALRYVGVRIGPNGEVVDLSTKIEE